MPTALYPATGAALRRLAPHLDVDFLLPCSDWDRAAAVRPGDHLPFAAVAVLRDECPDACQPGLPRLIARWAASNALGPLGTGAPLDALPGPLRRTLLHTIEAWLQASAASDSPGSPTFREPTA